MIDRLRKEIQGRLDQVLAEAEKLRKALAALDPRGGPAAPSKPQPAPRAAQRPTRTPSASPARPRTTAGATKARVLQALSDGKAMTAGEVAAATGLGRGTVSTTLTRLAKSGEVQKAERGYSLPAGASSGSDAAGETEAKPPSA